MEKTKVGIGTASKTEQPKSVEKPVDPKELQEKTKRVTLRKELYWLGLETYAEVYSSLGKSQEIFNQIIRDGADGSFAEVASKLEEINRPLNELVTLLKEYGDLIK